MNLKQAKRLRQWMRMIGRNPSEVKLAPLVPWYSITRGHFAGQRVMVDCGRKLYLANKRQEEKR